MLTFCLLIAGYLVLRVALLLPCRWYWRVLIAVIISGAALKFHIFRFFDGPRFFAPELPRWMLVTGSWFFAAVFILFFLLLISDLWYGSWLLISQLVLRKFPAGIRRNCNIISGILAVLAVLFASIGIISGFTPPEVRRVELTFSGLPAELDGFSIAVLADVHIDSCSLPDRLLELVRRTNAASPDLVVLPGDMVDGRVDELSGKLLPIAGLQADYGVFASPGNHEYYSGFRSWGDFFDANGVKMLINRHVVLKNGIVLAGVADPNCRRFGFEMPDFRRTLAGIPERSFVIILSHQPKLASAAFAAGADLVISGHTHGGMMPGFDRLIALFNSGFVSGEYNIGGKRLFVSNGAGIWSGFPVRLGRPAEIPLLVLRREKL